MWGPLGQIMTSCSGWATGKRRSINWSIRVKMAVLAPMPRESEATATKVKSGLRRRLRRANRRSNRNLAMAYKVSTPQGRKSLQKVEVAGTGDRQDCQRISGKERRKSMAVLS